MASMNNPIHVPKIAPGTIGTQFWNRMVSPGVKCNQGVIIPVLFIPMPISISMSMTGEFEVSDWLVKLRDWLGG